ncbi:MAG: hypothetical protein F6J93_22000 [Oscillatoria sp. SIO1A7]|nr:hypothetical protein [Oscillatoria sp. SIO1A7]
MKKRIIRWQDVRGNRYRKKVTPAMIEPGGVNELRQPKDEDPYFVHYDRDYVIHKLKTEIAPLCDRSEGELLSLVREAYRAVFSARQTE